MRQKLINAAITQYALHGYEGASMRKIADSVGIKPASIYFFYKNKETLFIAAFQQLLENHFQKMQTILEKNANTSVENIFLAMLHGLVQHHKGDAQGTIAYISLVTSPIPEIKTYLQEHFEKHNLWLAEALASAMEQSYPAISKKEIDRVVKQYILIANGVFWGVSLYDAAELAEQLELAERMLHTVFLDLEATYTPR